MLVVEFVSMKGANLDPLALVVVTYKWRRMKRKASPAMDDFDLLNAPSVLSIAFPHASERTKSVQSSEDGTLVQLSPEDIVPQEPPKKKVTYRAKVEESLKELRAAIIHCQELNRRFSWPRRHSNGR